MSLFQAIRDRDFPRFLQILDAGFKCAAGQAHRHTLAQQRATEVLGSAEEARRWLQEPAIGLNQQRPIDLLASEEGTELVMTYLEQIEGGVYV